MRALDTEHLAPRVGVGIEMNEPDRPATGRDRVDARLGDRVVAAESQRERTRIRDLSDQQLDGSMRRVGIGRHHGGIAVVDDAQDVERVDPRLEMRAGRA